MPNCDNCNSSEANKHLCDNCYNNIFKSLYCDGHCGRKCDPSQRTGSNIIALPWWWYCETCRKKRENPNLPPDVKREFSEDDIEKMKKKLKELEKKEKEWQEKNKEWNEKEGAYVEKLKATSGEFHKYRNQLQNFYDVIVDIDSLRNIKKGWKVKFGPGGKQNYETMKVEKKLIVGVVGNRNRGKSFLLSKLSNEVLPDGSSIKTEGISIKYPKISEGQKSEYILMDSAGFENALLETDEFKQEFNLDKDKAIIDLKEIASDKTLTEYFLQNFIIQKSDILMVVLGILSYNEQQLLNRIKIENKRKPGNPPLFVIHNLQTFSLIEQVDDYIKDTLMKSATFKLTEHKFIDKQTGGEKQEQNINKIYFIEEFYNEEDKVLKIFHLIMAMHGSEAGDYYNKFTYDFLSEQFNSLPNFKQFPVIEAVKDQLIESSKNIMEEALENDIFVQPEKTESDSKENTDLIKINEKTELKFKKCLIDELGFSSFYGKNFVPKYYYYKCKENKKPYICVEVEIPGENQIDAIADNIGGMWNITVSGTKNVDKAKDIEPKTSVNNRDEGKFNLNIKLDSNAYQLAKKKPNRKLLKEKSKNGLSCFYFELVDDDDEDSDGSEKGD